MIRKKPLTQELEALKVELKATELKLAELKLAEWEGGLLSQLKSFTSKLTRLSLDTSSTPRIQMPPGYFYTTLGKLFLNKETYERVVEQSILMMQEEHFEYYSQGSFKMARWVKIRFFFEFLIALGLNLPVIKQLLAFAK